MKRLRVLIATTEGPSEVQQIIEEDPEIRSVVCLDGTSEALPISAGYDAFVRKPTGIIERLYGHAAYRIDVSHPISGGRSWQLGLLVAHDLFATGQLATKGVDADEILWVTGEVRHNLDVLRVDHLREKLQQSAGVLHAAMDAGTRVTILVPEANRAEAAAELAGLGLQDKVRLQGVPRWRGAHDAQAASAVRPRRRVPIGAAIAAAVIAAAAYGGWAWRTPRTAAGLAELPQAPAPGHTAAEPSALPPPPRLAPAAPTPATRPAPAPALNIEVFAVEFRPPAGRTCGSQRLTGGGLTETVVDRDGSGNFPRRTALGLCDVEFRVKNTAATARHIWLYVQPTLDGTHPHASDATVDPGRQVAVRVGASPWQSGTPWDATVIVAVGATPALEIADRGARELTDALRAAHATYEVVSYSAAVPTEQTFK